MADPIIELHDVSVVLGGATVLESLTLTISDGEHAAILGPNGAGKSTLMKVLAFECYPLRRSKAEGTGDIPPPVRIFGRDRWHVSELRTQLGIVSAELHDRFVHGNCRGSITGLEAVLSGFLRPRVCSATRRSPRRCASARTRRWISWGQPIWRR